MAENMIICNNCKKETPKDSLFCVHCGASVESAADTESPKLKCEICGSADIVKQDGIFVCSNCGVKYSLNDVKGLLRKDNKPNETTMPISFKFFIITLIAAVILNFIYICDFSVHDGYETFSFIIAIITLIASCVYVKLLKEKYTIKWFNNIYSVLYVFVVLVQAFDYNLYRIDDRFGFFDSYRLGLGIPLAIMQLYSLTICVICVLKIGLPKPRFKTMSILVLLVGIAIAGFETIDLIRGLVDGFSISILSFQVWRIATIFTFSFSYHLFLKQVSKSE